MKDLTLTEKPGAVNTDPIGYFWEEEGRHFHVFPSAEKGWLRIAARGCANHSWVLMDHPEIWALFRGLKDGSSAIPIVDWLLENLDPNNPDQREAEEMIQNLCDIAEVDCLI